MRMSGETMVSTASADDANISVLLLWVSAWHIASSAMLRSDRGGMRVGVGRRFLSLDRSIHWARTLVARPGVPSK